MSKEKQSVLGMLLGKIDVALMWDDRGPFAVIPQSDRAKALFIQWGMDETSDGIQPPEDANDFMISIPEEWIVGMGQPEEERGYKIQEIALPQPKPMLH